MKDIVIRLTLLLFFCGALASAADRLLPHPQVEVVTSAGTFIVELDRKRAPLTVEHFLKLVDKRFYKGLIFHRVIADFMAQGGGFTEKMKLKVPKDTVTNESGNGVSNRRGTIAMARTEHPHSAGSQFYINVVDNRRLDPGKDKWGYTVFGYVIEGMEIVDKIANAQTGPRGEFSSDVPIVPIVIKKMSRYSDE